MTTSHSTPRHSRVLPVRPRPLPRQLTLATLSLALAVVLLTMARPPASASPRLPQAGGGRPIPVLAYYYIWYNPSSWNRAKIDYPLAGRYSSDDQSVMRQQVALAKQSGITGFLVSWKNTPVLDRRLARLRAVAAAAHFKLGIIFEGRNFHGQPLPLSEVRSGFGYLATHYGTDQVFNIFGRPLVAWSGTWEFTPAQLSSVTSVYGHRLVLLATEKQPASYQAIGHLFSGDAYYWSSADPLHTPGYAKKLAEFSATVHGLGGLWVAPAAPGFDAKLVGGSRLIPRRNGQTLRLEMNAAMASSPDAIGLISWNEYSENSEVEPSRAYGATALSVVASIEHAKAPTVRDFNSSSPSGFSPGPSQFVILGMLIVLLAGSVAVILRRRGRVT
jgi:hypothetical protein